MGRQFKEFVKSLLVAVVLTVVLRHFFIAPFYIPSGSMEPTLQIGDHILVNRLDAYLGDFHRGDIIVFRYPLNPRVDFVKRLIAFGGETVALRNSRLYVDGRLIPEKYLSPGTVYADFGPVKVPPGDYFVLGDNRNNSDDSRVWGFLPEKDVIGKVILIYWPPGRMSFY